MSLYRLCVKIVWTLSLNCFPSAMKLTSLYGCSNSVEFPSISLANDRLLAVCQRKKVFLHCLEKDIVNTQRTWYNHSEMICISTNTANKEANYVPYLQIETKIWCSMCYGFHLIKQFLQGWHVLSLWEKQWTVLFSILSFKASYWAKMFAIFVVDPQQRKYFENLENSVTSHERTEVLSTCERNWFE